MKCNDCIKYAKCKQDSERDNILSHRMWLIDFWENAEERCEGFKEATGENSEWCVACGDEIPEGRQVCPNCEKESEG